MVLGKLLRKQIIKRELERLIVQQRNFSSEIKEAKRYLKKKVAKKDEEVEIGIVAEDYVEVIIGDEVYKLDKDELECNVLGEKNNG